MADVVHEREIIEKNKISWGAIFAGVVLALVIQFMLSILGSAIGLSVVEPSDAPEGMLTGAMIWWVLTWLISLFIGGWTASRMSGVWSKINGTLHGLLTWAVTLIVTILLLTTAIGAVIGGALNLVGTVSSALGRAVPQIAETAGKAVPDEALNEITQEAREMLKKIDANDMPSRQTLREIMNAMATIVKQGPDAPQAKESVINILVEKTGMSRPEAEQKVEQWVSNYMQAKEKLQQAKEKIVERTEEVAEEAVDIAASAAWWSFFMILLGAVAAILGGIAGVPTHEIVITEQKSKT